MQSDGSNNESKIKEVDFNGAAVIDENGREIAITESMIQGAFDKLVEVSMLPAQLR